MNQLEQQHVDMTDICMTELAPAGDSNDGQKWIEVRRSLGAETTRDDFQTVNRERAICNTSELNLI